MENCRSYRRCLICRRPALENASSNSEKLISNATLLQDFLHCFHINVFDSVVNELSTSCQFCLTCEQFIAEWSSIQAQMTQLIRRAAQLKATLSALLLSASQIQEQNHNEDVTEIINNKMTNSREVQLPLLLQEIVDDIRNQLRTKYLVNVIVEKMQFPCQRTNLNQEEFSPVSVYSDNDDELMDDGSHEVYLPNEDQLNNVEASELRKDSVHVMSDKTPLPPVLKLDPLSVDYDNVGGTWDHWECGTNIQLPVVPKIDPLAVGDSNGAEPWESVADDSDEEYLPSEDEMNDDETPEQILGLSMETEEEASSDGSNFQHSKRTTVEAGSSKTNRGPKREMKRMSYTTIIPNGPNKFKYNGHDVRLINDDDQSYSCGVCNFNGSSRLNAVLKHIRDTHYTAEDKIKFTAVKTSDTEWLYGGKYKIIKVNDKFKCMSCGIVKFTLQQLVIHIRTQHVDREGADEVVPVTDTPSVNDLTPIQRELKSVPYTFNRADYTFTCGLCQDQCSSFNNLRGHIRRRHAAINYPEHPKQDDTRRMDCLSCNKQFYCELSFKRHMKLHELGVTWNATREEVKEHECEICGKGFFTLQHSKDHQRLRTGEKPYECLCGQKFPVSSYLTRHRQLAHGIPPEGRRLVKVSK